MEQSNPRAVVGNNSGGIAEAIERFDRSGYMLARFETLAMAVRDDRIDRGCLKVLAALIATMNRETCTSWAGREAIASQTGMLPKSVSNYIHQLKSLGYIVSERLPTPHANGRVLMHYTLTALSPEEIEAAVDWAIRSIRGEVETVVEFPSGQELKPGQFPSGRELVVETSRQDGNSLPVRTGTHLETSRPSGNSVPVPTGTRVESSRQDGHSNKERARIKNNTSITNVVPRGEGGVEGELLSRKQPSNLRGARLPDDWSLPKAWGAWTIENFHVTADQVRIEADRFKNHWLSKAGSGALKLDWFRTWQNWCASDIKAWKRRVIPSEHGGELFAADLPVAEIFDPKTERELREIAAISKGGR